MKLFSILKDGTPAAIGKPEAIDFLLSKYTANEINALAKLLKVEGQSLSDTKLNLEIRLLFPNSKLAEVLGEE